MRILKRHAKFPQVEWIPGPPICYLPERLGPWEDKQRQQTIHVVLWLWFYITIWTFYRPTCLDIPEAVL